ncbi:MAG TPA: hypothetical protein DEO88_15735 [Syntrophobacteraceae bacterium]|nr:hypothetical protein [Syntrophobacteraceae bacterium]
MVLAPAWQVTSLTEKDKSHGFRQQLQRIIEAQEGNSMSIRIEWERETGFEPVIVPMDDRETLPT